MDDVFCIFDETELNDLVFMVSQRFGDGDMPLSGDQDQYYQCKSLKQL